MLTDADTTVLFRSLLAALLGFVVGWERRAAGAPVRWQVITLTTMTSAAIAALGVEKYTFETSRVVAGIVTGVGFLGAGLIMRSTTGEVRGLATAAGLWAMSCIGIIVGLGNEVLGMILTLVTYVIIAWGEWPFVSRLNQQRLRRKAKESDHHQSSEIKSEL